MKNYLESIFVLTLLLCFTFNLWASTVKLTGLVTEENGTAIPFANVYIEGSSKGTTSNLEGYYTLDLEPGVYSIVYRFIGYKQKKEQVTLTQESVVLNVILQTESYNLKEVRISAGAEDPAYAIIRQAQKKRKDYLKEVEEYKCNAYVKSTQKLESYPSSLFGQKIDMGDAIDSVTKIFYLSESVSNFSFGQPDRVREEMISSTLSGDPKGYSFNKASDMLVDFYQNLIVFGNLTPRGIVSPISGSALFYYDYRLEGTFIENGLTVNKIKVIPKRKNDPVFTGDIFILDDSWRIHSLDLQITTAQQIQVIDTFRIKQSMLPVDKDRWLMFTNQYSYHFGILGFQGSGIVLGIFSQYETDPGFPDGYFTGQIMKVNKESNTKDSIYWVENRPVPLTQEEKVDYRRKDSTRIVHESKEYMDSMDSKYNKFSFSDLLSRYTYSNTYKNKSFSVISPLNNLFFNTVEGWNLGLDLEFNKRWDETGVRSLLINPSVRYGFSNTHWNGKIKAEYRYNPYKRSIVKVEGGTDVSQFNSNNPISPSLNSLYTLMAKKNYMKIFEKRYGRIEHGSELFNGVRLGIAAEYAERLPLKNTTDYSFKWSTNRNYTSNVPLYPQSEDFHFSKNNTLVVEGDLRLRIRQTYIDRPDGKYITGSKYPEIKFSYKKGLDLINANTDFDFMKISISDELRMGLLGKMNYLISGGSFLQKDELYFMDAYHFNGNKTWFTSFQLDEFKNLDYYTWSTTASFVEAHAEQNFGGFLLNKIPLIRKLKLNELATVHYFYTERAGHYSEISVGIEKLNLLRVEVYTSFTEGKRGSIGMLFGIKRTIGNQ